MLSGIRSYVMPPVFILEFAGVRGPVIKGAAILHLVQDGPQRPKSVERLFGAYGDARILGGQGRILDLQLLFMRI